VLAVPGAMMIRLISPGGVCSARSMMRLRSGGVG